MSDVHDSIKKCARTRISESLVALSGDQEESNDEGGVEENNLTVSSEQDLSDTDEQAGVVANAGETEGTGRTEDSEKSPEHRRTASILALTRDCAMEIEDLEQHNAADEDTASLDESVSTADAVTSAVGILVEADGVVLHTDATPPPLLSPVQSSAIAASVVESTPAVNVFPTPSNITLSEEQQRQVFDMVRRLVAEQATVLQTRTRPLNCPRPAQQDFVQSGPSYRRRPFSIDPPCDIRADPPTFSDVCNADVSDNSETEEGAGIQESRLDPPDGVSKENPSTASCPGYPI